MPDMLEAEESTKTLKPPPSKKGLARLIAAAGYSAAGIRAAFKSEEAVRMEIAAFMVLAPLGLWLGDGAIEKVFLVSCLVFVIVVELLNTGIEKVVDRVGKDYHELSRVAKDIGSAAVFISLGLVIFTWAMLLVLF